MLTNVLLCHAGDACVSGRSLLGPGQALYTPLSGQPCSPTTLGVVVAPPAIIGVLLMIQRR